MIIGSQEVGKSTLLSVFKNSSNFSTNYNPTAGVELSTKIVESGDKKIRLQLTDTPGQQGFIPIIKTHLEKANGVIFVYDVT